MKKRYGTEAAGLSQTGKGLTGIMDEVTVLGHVGGDISGDESLHGDA